MPSFPIQLKRNGTAAATPSSLLHGEVALNYADGKLFWKDASNVIQSFTFQAYALSSHTHAASDITSGTFDAARIANDSITYAKLQNVSATDRLLGRSSAGSGDVEEITCTAFGRSLIDDADAAAARTTLSVQPTASPAFTGAATVTNDGNVVPLTVTNTGTANSFVVNDESGDTTPFVIDAAGRVVIGATSAFSDAHKFAILGGLPSASGVSVAFIVRASIPSSTTSNYISYFSNVQTDAASFTLASLEHYAANQQGTFSAGSSVTSQYGFVARSSLTGATNNYGFYSDIASGTGRWNFYANGTAASYFGGQVQISAGSASACGVAFSGDPDTGIAQLSAGGANTLSICTNSAERVRFGSGGRVQYFANSEKFGVQLNKESTANGPFIGSDGEDIFCISKSGGAELMRLDANGSMGVGITAPTINTNGTVIHVHNSTASRAAMMHFSNAESGSAATNGLIVGKWSDNDNYFWEYGARPTIFGTSGTERMRIASDGVITMPDVYGDTVGATNRDLFIDDTGKLGYVSSIRASKTNIAAIDDVSWLRDLTPVSFHYRRKDNDGNYTDEPDGTLDYGLIADDVEPVAPELCFYDIIDGEPQLRGVHYSRLITPMLRYIQQLEARIAALEERINA